MDHFPTNWGRPVSCHFHMQLVASAHRSSTQRNDAFDAYGTYPIAQRPRNHPKDAFTAGIQRTQYAYTLTLGGSLYLLLSGQATDRNRNECVGHQVQGWNHDGSRQPWCGIAFTTIPTVSSDQHQRHTAPSHDSRMSNVSTQSAITPSSALEATCPISNTSNPSSTSL